MCYNPSQPLAWCLRGYFMTQDNNRENIPKTSEASETELDNLLANIVELVEKHKGNINIQRLGDQIKAFIEYNAQIMEGLSNSENLITMSQIEEMMLKLLKIQKEIDLFTLLDNLQNISAEDEFIGKKN